MQPSSDHNGHFHLLQPLCEQFSPRSSLYTSPTGYFIEYSLHFGHLVNDSVLFAHTIICLPFVHFLLHSSLLSFSHFSMKCCQLPRALFINAYAFLSSEFIPQHIVAPRAVAKKTRKNPTKGTPSRHKTLWLEINILHKMVINSFN